MFVRLKWQHTLSLIVYVLLVSSYSVNPASLDRKEDCFDKNGSKQDCRNVNATCETWGTCSQLCEDSETSFKCSCLEGFKLEPDNRTCTVTDPNVLIVYAAKKSVRVFNLNGGKQYSIIESPGHHVSVAVDVWSRTVLWTDITDKKETIYRRSIDGNGTVETLVDYGLELVEGLSVDWITGNLYFVDSEKKHIVVCSNNGYKCAIIVKDYLESPREITLHPNEGYMFWSNWGDKGSIIKAQMDGLRAKPLVEKNVHWPNGLTIDHGAARLYWSDAKTDVIETVDLNGEDRRMVHSTSGGHHFSLDVFGDHLFFSDWEAKEIQSCNKFNCDNLKSVVHEDNTGEYRWGLPSGLTVFHPAAQPRTRQNQCASAGCVYMCIITPKNGYKCTCPSGQKLDRSGKDCIDDEKTAKIVIARQNHLGLYRYGAVGRNIIDEVTLKEKTQIGAVHYNAINQTIFISDMFWHKIYEYNPKTSRVDFVVTDHVDTVTGLAFDVIGQNLYWTDSIRRKIEVISLKTKARALISSEKDYPQDIIVVPEKKFLFVTLTSSRWGRIMKYNMNGYNRSTLVRTLRSEPVSLTYNRELERLFWVDVYKETIEHISLEGLEQTVAVRTHGAFSISSFRNHIYWTDRFTQMLNAMTVLGVDFVEQPVFIGDYEDRHNSTIRSYIDGNFLAKISILQQDLTIYSDLFQRHECSVSKGAPGKCSHICLLSNDDYIGTCLCPDTMELEPDLRTCTPKCYPDQFQCNDRKCIAAEWKCDDFKDCAGGEDELDCPKTAMCDPLDFDCLREMDGITDENPSTTSTTKRPTTTTTTQRPTKSTTTTEKSWWPPIIPTRTFAPEKPRKESRPSKNSNIKTITNHELQHLDDAANGSDEITVEDRSLDRSAFDSEEVLRSQTKNGDSDGSGNTVTAVVITVVLLILIVTIVIGFILHKRRISPKTLVQPYVQQLVKYVNRPVQRWQDNNGANKREQFSNEVVYDETFDTISGNYGSGHFANPTYEEIDNLQNNEWNRNNSDSSKGESRSADSGILTVMDTDPNNLYEDIDDHYITYNHKQKLIDEKDLV